MTTEPANEMLLPEELLLPELLLLLEELLLPEPKAERDGLQQADQAEPPGQPKACRHRQVHRMLARAWSASTGSGETESSDGILDNTTEAPWNIAPRK